MESVDHGPAPDGGVRARVDEVFRLEYGRVVASVLRIVRDIDAAEEIAQEAFRKALDHWPRDGTPDRPGAWLLTTARRRALDHLRRGRRARGGAASRAPGGPRRTPRLGARLRGAARRDRREP